MPPKAVPVAVMPAFPKLAHAKARAALSYPLGAPGRASVAKASNKRKLADVFWSNGQITDAEFGDILDWERQCNNQVYGPPPPAGLAAVPAILGNLTLQVTALAKASAVQAKASAAQAKASVAQAKASAAQLERLQGSIDFLLAKSRNASSVEGAHPLEFVPRPGVAASVAVIAAFPVNITALKELDDPDLATLEVYYGFPGGPNIVQRRGILGYHVTGQRQFL